MTPYIDAADVARILRLLLKRKWPATKFEVVTHKYAGGASIRVFYIDGPPYLDVKTLCCDLEGSTFDAMTDLRSSRYIHIDADVYRAALKREPPVSDDTPPGVKVITAYGLANYVFVDRDYSVPVLREALAHVRCKYADVYQGEIEIVASTYTPRGKKSPRAYAHLTYGGIPAEGREACELLFRHVRTHLMNLDLSGGNTD